MLHNTLADGVVFFRIVYEHQTLPIQKTDAITLPAYVTIFALFGLYPPDTTYCLDCFGLGPSLGVYPVPTSLSL